MTKAGMYLSPEPLDHADRPMRSVPRPVAAADAAPLSSTSMASHFVVLAFELRFLKRNDHVSHTPVVFERQLIDLVVLHYQLSPSPLATFFPVHSLPATMQHSPFSSRADPFPSTATPSWLSAAAQSNSPCFDERLPTRNCARSSSNRFDLFHRRAC